MMSELDPVYTVQVKCYLHQKQLKQALRLHKTHYAHEFESGYPNKIGSPRKVDKISPDSYVVLCKLFYPDKFHPHSFFAQRRPRHSVHDFWSRDCSYPAHCKRGEGAKWTQFIPHSVNGISKIGHEKSRRMKFSKAKICISFILLLKICICIVEIFERNYSDIFGINGTFCLFVCLRLENGKVQTPQTIYILNQQNQGKVYLGIQKHNRNLLVHKAMYIIDTFSLL